MGAQGCDDAVAAGATSSSKHSGRRGAHARPAMSTTATGRQVECHGSSSVSMQLVKASMTVASLMPRGWKADRPSRFASLNACAISPKGSPSPGTLGFGGGFSFFAFFGAAFSSIETATALDERTESGATKADVHAQSAATRSMRSMTRGAEWQRRGGRSGAMR